MNVDEVLPDTFFVFVNQVHPVTHHNFNLQGRFFSGAFGSLADAEFMEKYISGKARYLPYEPCQMDLKTASPYFLTAINDYRIEYDAEIFREKKFPLYPSRLSAVYAFGDYATFEKISQRYGWSLDTVSQFNLLDHPLNRVVKVNMEHISLARHAFKVATWSCTDDWWDCYWSGEDKFAVEVPTAGFQRQVIEADVIWEYLIEGALERIQIHQDDPHSP